MLGGVAGWAAVLHHEVGGDGADRAAALSALVRHGELVNNPYSLIGPLFAAPLLAIDDRLLAYYNMIIFVLGAVAAYLALRRQVAPELLRTAGLVLAGASVAAPAVANFYGEMFTLVGLGLGMTGAVAGTRAARLIGWSAAVLGAANSIAALPALALTVAVWAVLRRRWRYAVPLVAAVALVLLESLVRRAGADPYAGTNHIARTVMPYSGRGGFSYPVFFGVLAILFSFGKGLVWYFPGLLLPAWHRLADPLRQAYRLWLVQLLAFVLLYAGWWSWYGGLYWGPRFFVLGILPASVALAAALRDEAASLRANLATLAVTLLSCWVATAAVVFPELPTTCTDNYYQLEFLCHFTPEFSALWHPFVAGARPRTGQYLVLAYEVVVFGWLVAPLLRRITAQVRDHRPTAAALTRGWRW